MRKISTRKILALFCLAILFFVMLLAPSAYQSLKWQQAVEAAGALPYQIGLTAVKIIQCQPSCCSQAGCRCCVGGALCATLLTEAQCLLHSEASGTPAGGMGSNALFLNSAIAQAGLTPGGQLIAGGLSPVLMDQGVLASAGGCYGCVAKQGLADKIFAWLDKFIIAGFKGK